MFLDNSYVVSGCEISAGFTVEVCIGYWDGAVDFSRYRWVQCFCLTSPNLESKTKVEAVHHLHSTLQRDYQTTFLFIFFYFWKVSDLVDILSSRNTCVCEIDDSDSLSLYYNDAEADLYLASLNINNNSSSSSVSTSYHFIIENQRDLFCSQHLLTHDSHKKFKHRKL